MQLPVVDMYQTWMDWARALVVSLQNTDDSALRMAEYTIGALPSAAKLRGSFILVSGLDSHAVPLYSDGSAWRRLSNNVEEAQVFSSEFSTEFQ